MDGWIRLLGIACRWFVCDSNERGPARQPESQTKKKKVLYSSVSGFQRLTRSQRGKAHSTRVLEKKYVGRCVEQLHRKKGASINAMVDCGKPKLLKKK